MLRASVSALRKMTTNSAGNPLKMIWIDCEMTGLDYMKQTLVEIAVIVTDSQLENVVEGPNIVIHQPESVLDTMEQWPRDMFEKNGLLEKIRASKIGMEEAENQVLEFLEKHTKKNECPLAGNTVYMDKCFIQRYMPRLAEHLHYRIIDVSTVKELARRWHSKDYNKAPKKIQTHRALDDIKESIAELKYYRQAVFKQP